ncbi:MAG: DEAD/DEAH box helicase family protein [Thermoplasmataceae archaeon]|jgi:type III restriction enzyme
MPNNEKIRPVYQRLILDITFDALPDSWDFKFERFSNKKILYDYQKEALKSGLKFLYNYYANLLHYPESDYDNSVLEGKKSLFNSIKAHLKQADALGISAKNGNIFKIANRFYESEDERIPFFNFANRIGFWMATGSGKSLVIVKLIEILHELKKRGSIPDEDILFLTYREDLIDQIKAHIDEFNSFSPLKIRYWDLKEYDNVKHNLLFSKDDVNVFIYRSDLISDTSSEKLLSFEDIENNGKWYIILDEAHKGNKEDSKRQIFYSILSRNGFLFNFSATFTDAWDLITTVFNLNLEAFTERGYGKNVYVSQQSMEAFERGNDNTDFEERKIVVLKTLITLAMVKKAYQELSRTSDNLYHNPLLVLYGNTTSIENSDLQIFFETLGEIALNKIDTSLFEEVKISIADEFENHPNYVFGNRKLTFRKTDFSNLTFDDVLKFVYNADSTGKIEVVKTQANKEELAFKLKTSDRYFASIKIGDITKWLKETLSDYEVSENPMEDSFFGSLNSIGSSINILMGSRAFYEGWDSNRPNVMVFVNIGSGDAKKYVLQSLGRGVRIEPLKDKRQRLETLSKNGDVEAKQILSLVQEKKRGGSISLMETLFVFGTNEQNLREIMESIKFEREKAGELIDVRKSNFDFNPTLLLPVYVEKKEVQLKELPKFRGNFKLLENYVNWIKDDRVIYALYSDRATPATLCRLHYYLDEANFVSNDLNNAHKQLSNLIDHLNTSMREMDKFKELEDEIIHFKEIGVEMVSEEKKKELTEKLEEVRSFKNPEIIKKELKRKLESKEIDIDEYTSQIEKLTKTKKRLLFDYDESKIELINLAHHYYLPIILSASDKADFINHIIKVDSEKEFVHDLDTFISSSEAKDLKIDWWVFSKIDESLDRIGVPYYDAYKNKMRDYSPDFIFWLKKGSEYRIVFVDPKSTKYTDYQQKADYFSKLFEDNGSQKEFLFGEFSIKVYLFMRTDNLSVVGEGYRKYWIDKVNQIFSVL